MKLKYCGKLSILLNLAEELTKQLENHKPDALLMVELTEDGKRWCSGDRSDVIFTYRADSAIHVAYTASNDGKRTFQLEGNFKHMRWTATCDFDCAQLEPAICAAAALMSAQIRGECVSPFSHYFHLELAAA